jgi:hypothetical protein
MTSNQGSGWNRSYPPQASEWWTMKMKGSQSCKRSRARPGSSAPRHRVEAAKSVDKALCNRRKPEPRVDSAQRISIYVLTRLLVRRIE